MRLKNGITRQREIRLSNNQVVPIKGRRVRIDCLSGLVWVTWPRGFEKSLPGSGSVIIQTKGKICIQAFSNARIRLYHDKLTLAGLLLRIARKIKQVPAGSGAIS